ncbi:DOMON domain-containing protein [Altererythrobacter lutimaris]|uniref:DOMON-like domain-containing protein n=1 Tax=Altererythrobacter lutimaris TaxID=2743979 RepID=A0A850H990_9SPHN|nr:hypothetical protein [Altererythrobacter lutimaris]NVE94070.1 hypothetical protein [Altererythrobacter lutimaris]
MRSLVLHPDCSAGPIAKVKATLQPTSSGCTTAFKLEGDISSIKVPKREEPERTDYLWETTCFEIFWQPDGGSCYREFNLSPSTRWAAYDFDDFRENARDAPGDNVEISCTRDAGQLVLEAEIVSALPVPANVALNAIVEDKEGNIQFWAMAFQEGKAEFHSAVCRQFRVEKR